MGAWTRKRLGGRSGEQECGWKQEAITDCGYLLRQAFGSGLAHYGLCSDPVSQYRSPTLATENRITAHLH